MSKAILLIRYKVICFKEDEQLFGDNGPHSRRYERSNKISLKSQIFPLFGDRET